MKVHTAKVHLYVGGGKGKTTAAAGLALRALGHGEGVLFVQFLKARPTGELAPLEQLGARVLRAKLPPKWLSQMSGAEREEARREHGACLARTAELLGHGGVFLCVLDEVVDAVNCDLVELPALLELIRRRPAETELVLTGRNPPEELVHMADYHTHFQCVRHPYSLGVDARRGIEY